MPADAQDGTSVSNELARFMWPFAKRVGIINGLLALVGISVALHVYLNFPIPTEISHHRLDKFGQPVGPESSLSYLFVFPCFQVWLVIVPLWGGWRATNVNAREQSRRDEVVATTRKLFPWARPADPSANFYRLLLTSLVMVQVGLLIAAIFRAVSAALGST
jgi:hypothetical protein